MAALGGVVVSVSRGALLAVVLATLATLVVGAVRLGPRRMPGLGQVVALSVLGAVAVWATGLVQGRSTSQEGAASAEVRTALFDTAFDIARADGWLGSGPGTADALTGRWLGQEIPLENSWLQLLVSLGMIGLVGMLVVFATTSLRAVGLRHVAVLPPLVALAVALAGYNAIEALLPMSTLVGLCPAPGHITRTRRRPSARRVGPRRRPPGARMTTAPSAIRSQFAAIMASRLASAALQALVGIGLALGLAASRLRPHHELRRRGPLLVHRVRPGYRQLHPSGAGPGSMPPRCRRPCS